MIKHLRIHRSSRFLSGLIASGLALLPAIAAAHPGHYHPPGEEDEFDALTAGFVHPLTGMDHLILALAAGWIAFSWKGGKARVPSIAFIASLVLGAVSGRGMQAGVALEIALAVTLLAAAAALVAGRNLRAGALITAVSVTGFIHGVAHGSEVASNVPFTPYAAAFTACTAMLLGIGGLLQAGSEKIARPIVPRVAACGLFALGSMFLIQAL